MTPHQDRIRKTTEDLVRDGDVLVMSRRIGYSVVASVMIAGAGTIYQAGQLVERVDRLEKVMSEAPTTTRALDERLRAIETRAAINGRRLDAIEVRHQSEEDRHGRRTATPARD